MAQKKKNNGLLITISNHDRKVAISTAIGTEQTISDYECNVIIDSIIIPQFRTNNYYKGVDKALDSLILLWD
ncbi:TPM domain-containing protein [Winogradskyella pacifica]|uniref:TPM domain-containing protein n=1 Tax=Winogradskyella pacifica TaxID=664642 RepID=UPI0015CCE326|nr:TPM domain-containing protein [Winogradskyella pacifica]